MLCVIVSYHRGDFSRRPRGIITDTSQTSISYRMGQSSEGPTKNGTWFSITAASGFKLQNWFFRSAREIIDSNDGLHFCSSSAQADQTTQSPTTLIYSYELSGDQPNVRPSVAQVILSRGRYYRLAKVCHQVVR